MAPIGLLLGKDVSALLRRCPGTCGCEQQSECEEGHLARRSCRVVSFKCMCLYTRNLLEVRAGTRASEHTRLCVGQQRQQGARREPAIRYLLRLKPATRRD
eukprot:4502874-Pleurochrysis_carterae.AAC.2